MRGYDEAIVNPVSLAQKEAKRVDLTLESAKASTSQSAHPAKPATGKPGEQTPEFFDEPQFTVAGVTQATNSGGHGSDTVLRNTEALAKATISLSKESAGNSSAATSAARENSLRDAIARQPDNFAANWQLGKLFVDAGKPTQALPYLERASRLNPADADAHHQLGDVEEKLGNPLEAVRQYQRAAEL